jgi:hypothetical protein
MTRGTRDMGMRIEEVEQDDGTEEYARDQEDGHVYLDTAKGSHTGEDDNNDFTNNSTSSTDLDIDVEMEQTTPRYQTYILHKSELFHTHSSKIMQ